MRINIFSINLHWFTGDNYTLPFLNFKVINVMKTVQFLLAAILLSSTFHSCTADKDNAISTKTGLKIQVVALNPSGSASLQHPGYDVGTNVITTLDLVSYNGKTGEVVFKNITSIQEQITRLRTKVNVYLNEKFLFSLIWTNDLLSNLYNEPVIHNSAAGYYVYNGYPWGVIVNDISKYTAQTTQQLEERKASFKAIETNWNIFIEQLKKEGKYIN